MPDADAVCGWIDRFVHGFNFQRPGLDRSLGRDIAGLVAEQIATRSATKLRGAWDPKQDGPEANVEWPPNEPKYRKRKRRIYGWEDPNYRTGQMLSLASLKGDPVVEPRLLTLTYGIDEPPDRTFSPEDNRTRSDKKADESVTDRQKAAWAHKGDRKRNRPRRPFFELDDEIRLAVVEHVQDALDDYIAKGR